ncbi:MAG: hypothetical protein KatS3mg115_0332 [Candidatus Poribacteria bacterium]|nr:MAG: hypothetical protein KatS3mg115_0332 [Candidatus Poribacteria bacterium]
MRKTPRLWLWSRFFSAPFSVALLLLAGGGISPSALAQQVFVGEPFAIDSTGETGIPSVNPEIQSVSIVFQTDIVGQFSGYYRYSPAPAAWALRTASSTSTTTGFIREQRDIQPTPPRRAGQTIVNVVVPWDGLGRWQNQNDPVPDGLYNRSNRVGKHRRPDQHRQRPKHGQFKFALIAPPRWLG